MATKKIAGIVGRIAGDMRAELEEGKAAVHRQLERGLHLVLAHNGKGYWRLAMGRKGVYPSSHEIEVCRKAFGLNTDDELWSGERVGKDGVRWMVAEYRWIEC